MKPDEIIDRLKQVSFTYSRLTADTFSAEEVARDKQALTAAVQAVELLEQIKQDMCGECRACEHVRVKSNEEPCKSCFINDSKWEFRWPLGEEADHETN